MLGHDVDFAYCRAPGSDVPCRRIFDCWWEAFDVEAFVREHFGQDVIDKILAPPPDKRVSLYELIRKAQQAKAPQDPQAH